MSIALPASVRAAAQDAPAQRTGTTTIRIPELDGLRGLMTLFVMVSHYFGEVRDGLKPLCVGWVAVNVFFVLSGYLVGCVVLEKMSAGNFLPVFYMRRITRTFPIYLLCCALIMGGLAALPWPWAQGGATLPAWSYFVFLQNVFVIAKGSVGVPWLSPTWTLALEEQFYLVVPFLFLLVPRRHWIASLLLIATVGVGARALGVVLGPAIIAPMALLPASADVLGAGLLLAVLTRHGRIPWTRWQLLLRTLPVLCLFATFGIQHLDAEPGGPAFQVLGPTLVAVASASLILMLIKDAPEAARFRSPVLRFCGDISYGIYLTHLAVLGLVHGILFGAEPRIGSGPALAATVLAMPLTVGVAWLLTHAVERPITAWGRGFRWQ